MTSVYAPTDDTPEPPGPRPPGSLDHGLTMFGYLLLFFSIFFGGVPAVIAVVLAYARRKDADDPVTRSHLRFQIRTFWWCFWLTVLAVIALVAGLAFGARELMSRGAQTYWTWLSDGPLFFATGLSTLPDRAWAAILLIASGVLALWSVLWSWFAPVWGALKLAFGKPIGRV